METLNITFDYELLHWYQDAKKYLTMILGEEKTTMLMHYEAISGILKHISFLMTTPS